MKMLTTSSEINEAVCRLIQECSSCQIVVAWATVGFDAYAYLVTHRAKIAKMVVGTHFYQTDPKFIETFLTDSHVKFIKNTNGVFHPKVYFFEKNGTTWECLIGSSNFTSGGFGKNVETAVLISGDDFGATEALGNLTASIDRHWENASCFTSAELDEYRKKFEQKEPFITDLQGDVERQLSASNLMEFSRTLHGKTITTFASRKKEIGTLFTVKVTSCGIEFLPLSSKNKMPFISRIDEVQKICDKYERLGKSKVTSDYQNDCRTSTYLITVIDLFENNVSSGDSRELSHQPNIG